MEAWLACARQFHAHGVVESSLNLFSNIVHRFEFVFKKYCSQIEKADGSNSFVDKVQGGLTKRGKV